MSIDVERNQYFKADQKVHSLGNFGTRPTYRPAWPQVKIVAIRCIHLVVELVCGRHLCSPPQWETSSKSKVQGWCMQWIATIFEGYFHTAWHSCSYFTFVGIVLIRQVTICIIIEDEDPRSTPFITDPDVVHFSLRDTDKKTISFQEKRKWSIH